MARFRSVLASGVIGLGALSFASAAFAAASYVDARTGTDSGACPITVPCASLNYALSQQAPDGQIIILNGGKFGPVILDSPFAITGTDPNSWVSLVATTPGSGVVGCIGATAANTCHGHANNGYAMEIVAGATDTLKVSWISMQMGSGGGIGAFKLSSGGQIQIAHDIFRGNGAATTPIILLAPNNPGTTQSQMYFSNSDVGFNNGSSSAAGAVLVQPIGTTSFKLHFNHVEVHNASFGIRTDGSSLSSGAVVASFISESEFFSFPNAAVNAASTAGTGTVNAVFDFTRILNAGVALKANGPQSIVILTNNTVGGNTIGVQQQNGASVLTSGNNTITGNGPSNNQNVVGTLTAAPLQ
ncbi:MAG TPA: hypothetical protein VIJ52_06765 [Pseudolabrys sp.]